MKRRIIMGWYKNITATRPGGSYRDTKRLKTLWHISPDRLSALMPRSSFWGISGVFLSGSYKSIMHDWWGYIQDKKGKGHMLFQQLRSLRVEIDKMEAENPEDPRLNELEDKRNEIADKVYSEDFQRANQGYSKLFLHKISCPKEVYDEAVELYQKAHDAGYKEGKEFEFWLWGDQTFIPAKDLSKLEIVSVTEMDAGELIDAGQQRYR